MKHKNIARIIHLAVVAIAFTLVAQAQDNENVLFNFHDIKGNFGVNLVQDPAGNLYGVTAEGGNPSCGFGCGLVFKLTNSGGTWVATAVHSFTGGADGYRPVGLAVDTQGTVYGTASGGGTNGSGIFYKISFTTGGLAKFAVLHSFPDGPQDGTTPGGVTVGPDGNLYGATEGGGSTNCGGSGCGTVFKLSPTAQGTWKEAILHRFSGPDGDGPFPPVVFDPAGNIYGVAELGGAACGNSGCGTAFKLSPNATRGYTETTLHRFTGGTDGSYPVATVSDASGNVFGITLEGGNGGSKCSGGGCGTVFELSPGAGSNWIYSRVYTFTYTGDGDFPNALTTDSSGNLFGAATFAESGVEGSVFEISPVSGGGWNFSTLYLFSDPAAGGAPTALILGSDGNLYGTTETGGLSGDGVAFEVVTSPSSRN